MLNQLIQLSLRNRLLVLIAAIAVLFAGMWQAQQLPIEVLPDLTKPTVTIMTEAPGLAPEEVETRVTVPLENACNGISGMTRLRSTSDVALSLVFIEFDWGTDIYHARQLVQERLQGAVVPEDTHPYLTPVASLMGEIMLVGLRPSEGSKVTPRELRTMADWQIRRQFQGINGIAEVLSMGAGSARIEILPEPRQMLKMGISFADLQHAASEAASNTTGGFLTSGPREILVRNLAMTTDLTEISQTVVKIINDRPVSIGDVAEVKWGTAPMRGDAAIDGIPGVIMSITKAPGVDTRSLTLQVEKTIEELRQTLPDGIEVIPLFRQADFIDLAISNLWKAIWHGAVFVAIILLLFLLNIRTTFITLTAIPLSFSATALVFAGFGISVNSMTLGGLAVAIGMVVDDAIVDVENVFRRLRENAALKTPLPRLEVIASASSEVRSSILYATIFIILVFLPLSGLSGVAGRLFTPIATATIFSMAASFVVSLTVIPVLCSFLLRPKENKVHRDNLVVRFLKWLLKVTWLRLSLSQPIIAMLIAGLMLAGALTLYPLMGKDFLPSFREETALVSMTAAPGTSLQQTNELSAIADRLMATIPEIRHVGRRVGRAEHGDHVVPVSTVEFDIDFDTKSGGRSRREILNEIREKVRQIPGTFSVLTGPLTDRIGHMLSGVPAKVAIKIYGPDLNELRRLGEEVQKVAREIPGFENARIEQQAPIPQLRIEVDRERAMAYGVTPGKLNDQLSALLGGRKTGTLFEGQRSVDLVIQLSDEWRESPERLLDLYIDTETERRIPLRLVAQIRHAKGPNVIQREATQRRLVVSINPTARDLGGLVDELRRKVEGTAEKKGRVKLPGGYRISWEGEFKARQEATKRIAILSGFVFLIVCFLLHSYFKSANFVAQVIFDIPLALIGGLIYTRMELDNISIATLVGFIAVAGISIRNSIMLLSHYLHLMRHEGESFTRSMIERGTLERLVPVLMTALSAGIALMPLVLAGEEPGTEILNPVAVVIVGGLITSTILGLGVTPAVFYAFGRKAAQRALEMKAPAAN